MISGLLLSSIILAFIWAKLEIHVEGRDGWAANLPTWRLKNGLTDFILSGAPLTGYHVWMVSLLFFAFHIPFFVSLPWSFHTELQFIGVFLIFLIMEDFMWFLLNPSYGISKFNKEHIWWHKKWILSTIPLGYIYALSAGGTLITFSTFIK